LANFAGLFVLCAVALMGGQGNFALGIEWFVVSSGACAVYVYGYLQARTAGGSRTSLSLVRTRTGTTLYVALIAGSVVLLFGATAGLYIAAVALEVRLQIGNITGRTPANSGERISQVNAHL
jgi:hypothetical protein